MNNDQLINIFGNRKIYYFSGKKSDLEQILFANSASYNYAIIGRDIYFITEIDINHPDVTIVYDPIENTGE